MTNSVPFSHCKANELFDLADFFVILKNSLFFVKSLSLLLFDADI